MAINPTARFGMAVKISNYIPPSVESEIRGYLPIFEELIKDPATDNLTLGWTGGPDLQEVSVFDNKGKTVITRELFNLKATMQDNRLGDFLASKVNLACYALKHDIKRWIKSQAKQLPKIHQEKENIRMNLPQKAANKEQFKKAA